VFHRNKVEMKCVASSEAEKYRLSRTEKVGKNPTQQTTNKEPRTRNKEQRTPVLSIQPPYVGHSIT
jgi:hypothetical protein